jgi:hypothetical protein
MTALASANARFRRKRSSRFSKTVSLILLWRTGADEPSLTPSKAAPRLVAAPSDSRNETAVAGATAQIAVVAASRREISDSAHQAAEERSRKTAGVCVLLIGIVISRPPPRRDQENRKRRSASAAIPASRLPGALSIPHPPTTA